MITINPFFTSIKADDQLNRLVRLLHAIFTKALRTGKKRTEREKIQIVHLLNRELPSLLFNPRLFKFHCCG